MTINRQTPSERYGIDEEIFETHDFVCTECKQPCRPKALDFGIGPFEFWGQRGYDSQPDVGSDCCEALMLHLGYEYTYDDYSSDKYDEECARADDLYEARRESAYEESAYERQIEAAEFTADYEREESLLRTSNDNDNNNSNNSNNS